MVGSGAGSGTGAGACAAPGEEHGFPIPDPALLELWFVETDGRVPELW